MLHTISNRQVDNSHHCHPQLVVNLSTEVVVLLAWYQPAGLHCRMLSALHHLDQVQSLCSPCCADKSEHSSHHNSISLLHSHLLLPFLPSTQRHSHTVHRPNTNRLLSLHPYYFISIPKKLIYSQAQLSNCSVQICDTVTNITIIYICPFSETYLNFHGQSDASLIKHNKLTHLLCSYKKCAVHKS